MQKLAPADRSYLWRIHLALYLAQYPTLTKDQQNVILDTLVITSPQLFTPPDGNDPTWREKVHDRLERLRQRGLQLFAKEDAAEIFSMFGQRQQEMEALQRYLSLSEQKHSDRRASFRKLSAQDKADLWHVHFALNLAKHPDWNEQQRSLVVEAMTIVTPTLYETPKDANWSQTVDAPVRLFMQRVLISFSKIEAAELFSDLGGKEPLAHHARPAETPACDCSRESDWCTYDCWSNQCKSSPSGCGSLWLYPCDGLCYWPPELN